MKLPCIAQALFDQTQVRLRRRNARLGLLLKRVQHKNDRHEAYGIDCAEGIAAMICDEFDDFRISGTLENLRLAMPTVVLRKERCMTHFKLHIGWKVAKVPLARADPNNQLQVRRFNYKAAMYSDFTILSSSRPLP